LRKMKMTLSKVSEKIKLKFFIISIFTEIF
jgi:hypothetical protein